MPMGKGYGINAVKGMYSSKPKEHDARRVTSNYGPGSNPDQMKADKLLKMAHKKDESLRGRGIM